jgi:hypothetical protein
MRRGLQDRAKTRISVTTAMGHSRPLSRALLTLAACLALASCSDDKQAQPTAPPPSPPVASPTSIAGTPTAAGISGTPQTSVSTPAQPPDAAAAEAFLRRVTLFGTDVPPTMTGGQVTVENTDAVAPRAADPAMFAARARGWSRIASSRVAFEGSSDAAGPRFVRGGAIRFATEDGARAQMAALRDGQVDDALATVRLPAGEVPLARVMSDPIAPPAVGDEALAWRLRVEGSGGAPAGVLTVFRRQSAVGIVVLIGADDPAPLLRALDMRAAEALR